MKNIVSRYALFAILLTVSGYLNIGAIEVHAPGYADSPVNFENKTPYTLAFKEGGDLSVVHGWTNTLAPHKSQTLYTLDRGPKVKPGKEYVVVATVTIPKSKDGDAMTFELLQKVKSKVVLWMQESNMFQSAKIPGKGYDWHSDRSKHTLRFSRGKEKFVLTYQAVKRTGDLAALTDKIEYTLSSEN